MLNVQKAVRVMAAKAAGPVRNPKAFLFSTPIRTSQKIRSS